MGPPGRRDVAHHRVGGQKVDVAVAAGGQHHGVRRVGRDLAGDEVTGDDAARPTVLLDDVEQFGAAVQFDGPGGYLAHQGRVGADE